MADGALKGYAAEDSASGGLGRGFGVEGGNGCPIRGKLDVKRTGGNRHRVAVDGDEMHRGVSAVSTGGGSVLVGPRIRLRRGVLVAPVGLEMAGMPLERPGGLTEKGGSHQDPKQE